MMLNRIRPRLSYANVTATIALFVALGGGAYATHTHRMGTEDLRNRAVTAPKLANNAVPPRAIRQNAVRPAKIQSNAVRPRHIRPGAVGAPKLADGAVTPAKLACGGNGPDDHMVRAGPVCIDRYEASIWDAPVGGDQIIGSEPSDYCSPNGHDCDDIYARSVPGVEPAANITWFQAQQALANSGKRLPSNAEWQLAVAGTPADAAACNKVNTGAEATGNRPACVSRHGAQDMVGNVSEWVADWDEQATDCTPSGLGGAVCIGGAPPGGLPGALLRGGHWSDGVNAGQFALDASATPSHSSNRIGFRGAR